MTPVRWKVEPTSEVDVLDEPEEIIMKICEHETCVYRWLTLRLMGHNNNHDVVSW